MNNKEGLQNLFNQMKEEAKTINDRDSRVLIVDGLNLFIRTFAASPAMNHRGDHVGGLLGFMKSLFSYIRKFNPTRVIIAFDGKDGAKRRREIYPEYKDGRKSKDNYNRYDDMQGVLNEEKSFVQQISRLDKYLRAIPITSIIMNYVEADDIIGFTVSEYYAANSYQEIIIVSSDQDFLQLVSEDVKVYSPTKRKVYDLDLMVKEFKIPPENYLTLKTFIGDKTDNIKGVKGIGLKTMLNLFPEFSEKIMTPEDIIESSQRRIDEGSKKKTYSNVVSASNQLSLNWELMQLSDVDIPSSKKMHLRSQLDDDIPPIDKEELRKLFYEDGLYQHIKYFDSWVLSSLSQIALYAKETD